ncbi:hypothetical protein HanHA300_Chr12g0442561 [Helianthus annuus]|nr:hypothetical protein HanHA300_Chr12g0442561 [Helianthus annuus]KAJ0674876.1 hypothetical protein HanLR1_Chr12g0444791 [Helianthus annuus]
MFFAASPRRTHTNEKRVSFDIENDTNGGLKYSNTTDFVDRNREVLASNKSPIVVVDILKTSYNRKLLGDDQGKFPAPLLMNTFHYGMQAVFFKGDCNLVYFWSEGFQPTVTMSWKRLLYERLESPSFKLLGIIYVDNICWSFINRKLHC